MSNTIDQNLNTFIIFYSLIHLYQRKKLMEELTGNYCIVQINVAKKSTLLALELASATSKFKDPQPHTRTLGFFEVGVYHLQLCRLEMAPLLSKLY